MTLFKGGPLNDLYHRYLTNPKENYGDNAAFHSHMPTMRLLCHNKFVVELGARFGTSTVAILASRPKALLTVDIERKHTIDTIEQLAAQEGINFTFITANDLEIPLPSCDILFIDTLHTYTQLRQELELHGNLAREYIIFHDTESFGTRDELNTGVPIKGLLPAIEEFVIANPHWELATYYLNCNGLLILRRVI
jgi:hypothetical protein